MQRVLFYSSGSRILSAFYGINSKFQNCSKPPDHQPGPTLYIQPIWTRHQGSFFMFLHLSWHAYLYSQNAYYFPSLKFSSFRFHFLIYLNSAQLLGSTLGPILSETLSTFLDYPDLPLLVLLRKSLNADIFHCFIYFTFLMKLQVRSE